MDPLSEVRLTLSSAVRAVRPVLKRSQWSSNDYVLDDAKPCITLEIL